MGIRFLFLLAAFFAIWLIIRFYLKTGKSIEKPQQPAIKTDSMVACDYCGLHIPEKEAIKSDSHFYCCQQHAQLKHEQTKR